MTKLFASDFDGTLHFWETDAQYLVSPTDTQAIFDFQAAGGLFGKVDVEADNLVVLIDKAHRREVVVEAEDDFFGGFFLFRCRGFLLAATAAAAAGQEPGGQNHHQTEREKFFHLVGMKINNVMLKME